MERGGERVGEVGTGAEHSVNRHIFRESGSRADGTAQAGGALAHSLTRHGNGVGDLMAGMMFIVIVGILTIEPLQSPFVLGALGPSDSVGDTVGAIIPRITATIARPAT